MILRFLYAYLNINIVRAHTSNGSGIIYKSTIYPGSYTAVLTIILYGILLLFQYVPAVEYIILCVLYDTTNVVIICV